MEYLCEYNIREFRYARTFHTRLNETTTWCTFYLQLPNLCVLETMSIPLLLLLLLLFQLEEELLSNAFFHTDLTLTDKWLFWDPTISYRCLVGSTLLLL